MQKIIMNVIGLFVSMTTLAQKDKTIEIPFTMDRNLIIIKAQLDKRPEQGFIFDTGTEGIMLLDYIAADYKSSGLDTMVTPTGEFAGIQEKVILPGIKFNGLVLRNKEATKMPRQMLFSNYAVGIIGMKTFAGYLITIDYRKGKLILSKGSLQQQPHTIPINLDHILETKVKLNGIEVLAHFDCGGAGYISVPKKWDSIYKLKSEAVPFGKGRTPMGDFEIFSADLDGSIEVGDYKLSNPKISLVTGDFFVSVNFGYEFFRAHLITIDTKNKLMQILK